MRFQDIVMAAAPQPVVAAGGGLGPELVTNGNFASASDWSLDAGDGTPPSISAGALRFDVTGDGAFASQTIGDEGTSGTFRIVYTIVSISTGSVNITLNDVPTATKTTAGTYSEDIASVNGNLSINGSFTNAVIDNVSCKQVL